MATAYKQKDNHSLSAKLDLRRLLLHKYHNAASGGDPIRVMDCCAGSGSIWSELRKEFPVDEYWALDKKQKLGRLKIDSARVLAQAGWSQNIVDIDTYGSPFGHWYAMLPNVFRPTTVFLTIGQIKMAGGFQGKAPKEMVRALGLDSFKYIPPSITAKLWGLAIRFCIADVSRFGLRIIEAVEAVSNGSARYLAIRLEPMHGARDNT